MGEAATSAPPRLRAASTVDLSKAKPGCGRCHGRGISGHKHLDLQDGAGVQRVPMVCRCVSRNDGVQQDVFDRIMAEVQEQLESGHFAANLATDIKRLPPQFRGQAVKSLRRDAADPDKDARTRDALAECLRLLEE